MCVWFDLKSVSSSFLAESRWCHCLDWIIFIASSLAFLPSVLVDKHVHLEHGQNIELNHSPPTRKTKKTISILNCPLQGWTHAHHLVSLLSILLLLQFAINKATNKTKRILSTLTQSVFNENSWSRGKVLQKQKGLKECKSLNAWIVSPYALFLIWLTWFVFYCRKKTEQKKKNNSKISRQRCLWTRQCFRIRNRFRNSVNERALLKRRQQ